MRIIKLVLLGWLLVGCQTGYQADVDRMHRAFDEARHEGRARTTPAERLRLAKQSPHYQRGLSIHDSLLQLGPRVRYYDDALAHADSVLWLGILLGHVSNLYFERDTVVAVYTWLEAWPWIKAASEHAQVDQARQLAETLGDVVDITQSPNMARLAYQSFEHAKQLALAHGDPQYIHLADSSYTAVARRVLTMPDSVRAAFGPPPERPARIPWVLATIAAAFIAVSVAGEWERA